MVRRSLVISAVVALAVVYRADAVPAQGLPVDDVAPAHISIVEGSVTLERDGRRKFQSRSARHAAPDDAARRDAAASRHGRCRADG